MKREIAELDNYAAKSNDAKTPYDGINKIIKGFRDGDFLIKDFGKQAEQPSGSKDEQESSGSKDEQESDESDEFDEVSLGWTYNQKIKDLEKNVNKLNTLRDYEGKELIKSFKPKLLKNFVRDMITGKIDNLETKKKLKKLKVISSFCHKIFPKEKAVITKFTIII